MYLCDVYVTNSSLNVNQPFTYVSNEFIDKYKRVHVIFAKTNNVALVFNCTKTDKTKAEIEAEKGFKLNNIIDVIDDEPILNDKLFELAIWLSKTTISSVVSCINTMLPKALKTSKNVKSPRTLTYIKKTNSILPLTKRQKEILSFLNDDMLLSDARKLSISIVNKLIENGYLAIYEAEKEYIDNEIINNTSFKKLTNDQALVYNSFINSEKQVSLLFGVTGSGKTEVYLHLARKYLNEGKEVLILVPEISLTPQMISRVKERFNDVVFYHSELSDQERYEQYKRIKNKETKIVVGTRSSIFLPFSSLGLIIVDEEHDNSYKQDNMPCYNAISVAKKLAHDYNAKVLLASATPSLDSYTRALKNDYQLLELKERINNKLPKIEIVDLVKEVKNKSSYIISNKLKEALDNTLESNKQAIILLNRRGYAPVVKCFECGTTLMCSSCDIPLSYHKDENILKCHECGRVYKLSRNCPKCNSNKLTFYGFGTKKVEEELKKLYPNANIDRMDRDNVSKKGAHKQILDKVKDKKTDILIGTQMIAKGLDFPDVTLVGILNADAGLMHQDYNSAKQTFDLLMQASGRSGRADSKGKVIIQAFNPEHYALKAVLNQDYEYFYNIEMNYRSKMLYPPYSHILEIIISDINENRLEISTKYLEKELSNLDFKIYKSLRLGKIQNLSRNRILIMDKDISKLIVNIWKIIDDYLLNSKMSKIKIDIDPLYLE